MNDWLTTDAAGVRDGRSGGSGRYAGQPPRPYETGPLDFLRILVKHRGKMLLAFLAIILPVAAWMLLAPDVYVGTGRVLIGALNPAELTDEARQAQRTQSQLTQSQILASRQLAADVVRQLELWNHPEFGGPAPDDPAAPSLPPPDDVSGLANAFLAHLSVVPIIDTEVLAVSYESTDPQLAADAVNTLMRRFVEEDLEASGAAYTEVSDWLQERLDEQRVRIAESERALQEYREQANSVSLDDRQNIVVQRLADINTAVTAAQTARIQQEAVYNQLQQVLGDPEALFGFPAILENAVIQSLRTRLEDLRLEEVQLGERYGDRHPEMVRVRNAIRDVDAQLQAEVGRVVSAVQSEYEAAVGQEARLTAELEAQKREALDLNRRESEYTTLVREVATNRQLFDNLMRQSQVVGPSAELQASTIRVVDAAVVPGAPVRPLRLRNLLLAAFGGLCLAVALAYGFEFVDSRIRSPEEVVTHLRLPFMGYVPRLAPDATQVNPLISNGTPPSFKEAFRRIRSNVMLARPEQSGRTLVVTSTGPREGKTVVASNLALALAQAGQRVILLDADMRRPKVHIVFGQNLEPGLSNLLAGRASDVEVIRPSEVSGLFLLPAGTYPPSAADLLASPLYTSFLENLRETYDWIVIDSPPVMAVTDASIVAHDASGVMFVVGSHMTRRDAAQTALDELEAVQARFVGAVLNHVDVDKQRFYHSRFYNPEYQQYYTKSPHA